ncbi:MAG: (deoxy)nucleoside triphosphate pyrophosphohydrolase [Candidatus Omnitrophica bacterium]|nr:(deoxy)nucleoside triphosphate pyrophosphohydrolase [Candidatus Omnitrophota bacterium]
MVRGLAKPRYEVAVGIIEQDGKILLTQRKAGDHLGGYWEFVGGKCLVGESPAAALRREAQEELGVVLGEIRAWRRLTYNYSDRVVELHVHRCRILSGRPRALDCAGFRWVDARHLTPYNMPSANAPIIAALRQRALYRGGSG